MQRHLNEKMHKENVHPQLRKFRNGATEITNSVSSNNPWDVFNIDEVARKYFMDSLANSDGFSAPQHSELLECRRGTREGTLLGVSFSKNTFLLQEPLFWHFHDDIQATAGH